MSTRQVHLVLHCLPRTLTAHPSVLGEGRSQIIDLQREHLEEYEALKLDANTEERELLINDYEAYKESERTGARASQKSKSMIVAHACKDIERIVREFCLGSILSPIRCR